MFHTLRFLRQLETWVSLLVLQHTALLLIQKKNATHTQRWILRLQLMEEAPQTQVLQYEELQLMRTTILVINSFAFSGHHFDKSWNQMESSIQGCSA